MLMTNTFKTAGAVKREIDDLRARLVSLENLFDQMLVEEAQTTGSNYLFTPRQAAIYLNLNEATVRNLMAARKLSTVPNLTDEYRSPVIARETCDSYVQNKKPRGRKKKIA